MGSVSIWSVIAVGSGGFLGAVSRYLISALTTPSWNMHSLPYGTITANLLGCFLIGLLAGVFQFKEWMNPDLRLFVFVGILGGFTTFSTFSSESFLLWKAGEIGLATWNLIIQIAGGLILVWSGYFCSKWFS
ncbi:fluoride efflux transporter CrcB [Balneola sp. MJW-20]|uniref:fluoride efflux transporter CrcB n=1 Tax=Gracilimonas aurantiaca TaxID=3234185 RepID=UPI0034666DAE